MTKKDVDWKWDDKCQQSFEQLRDGLVSAPTLAYADMNEPFILTTDASNVAIGYILSQKINGVEHVIAYAGRALRKSELNYGITDKEGLAIVEGFRHFHTYLFGNITTVITDHSALSYIQKHSNLSGRVARWALELLNYDFTVVHRKGSDNTNADALSRLENLPTENPQEVYNLPPNDEVFITDTCDSLEKEDMREWIIIDDAPLCETSMTIHQSIDIVKEQKECPEIGPIYEYIKTGNIPENSKFTASFLDSSDQFGIRDNVLIHMYRPRTKNIKAYKPVITQTVVPKSLRKTLLSEYHDSLIGGGHQGFDRTYEAIKNKYYWPRMYEDIREYQKSCLKCQKASNHMKKPPPLHPLPVSGLFQRWHMDFLGPLPASKCGKKYILLVCDSFSRWCEAFALPAADSKTVAKVLYSEIFTRYGAPRTLVSDRGQHFMSTLVKALCDIFGTKRNMTSPYHPASNSVCERMNSFIVKSLRSYVRPDQSDWPAILPGIMMAYRHTPASRSTEFSPFYLLFGQAMNTPLDTEIRSTLPDVSTQFRPDIKAILDNVKLSRDIATENIERNQQKNKLYYDRNTKAPQFAIGDLVWLHNPATPVGLSRKLRSRWVGPYTVCEIGPNHTYRLRHYNTHIVTDTLMNAGRLKHAVLHDHSAIRNDVQVDRQADQSTDANQRNGHHINQDEAPQTDSQPVPNNAHDPLDTVEKVVDLSRNNKGKWYRVKLVGKPGTKWYLEGAIDIPQEMIDACLKYRTWQGKRRKRKTKKQ